ncbi:LANO_0B04544g1_1 [Lachancea nothofagi CBS 11611]|uniref:Palmitoyltransferase n=1 Tax=Lachancea nothofagi CBS 11611 TaxID=1266666 RepID=A0A1G4IY27_9SACH|nr:LANO_0B04544g1_1 [Lachancea nothofagi CBS 11611]
MSSRDNLNDAGKVSESENERTSLSSIESIAPIVGSEHSLEEVPLTEADEGGESSNPILRKYREACQSGDLSTVKALVESEAIDLKHDYDEDMVSGLHWASINNRLGVVKYLAQNGADVNFQGGKLVATPLHWAARYGYVYIVDFLLEKGADPTLVDQQGFNLLHLSINSSNIMLVLYVLFFVVGDKLNIDSLDPNNRTSLLWAAYQGDSLSVKALLDFNANATIVDSGGFSPLHWATVKGQPQVLKALIAYGCDFFQKTKDKKDCFVIAKEMNTEDSLSNALMENGLNTDGTPIKKYFSSPQQGKLVTFVTPWILVASTLKLFASINFFIAIVFTAALWLSSLQGLKNFVIPSYSLSRTGNTFLKTPFLAGILLGSVACVIYVWFTRVMLTTIVEEPVFNLLFVTLATICVTSFCHLVLSDAGKISKEDDYEQTKGTIKELLRIGKFDTRNFCTEIYVRRPLRSKYSRFNDALITRFDHFCPWIYNDVGLKNHKLFQYFLLSLLLGVIFFTKTCLEYFDVLEDESDIDFKCGIFEDEICAGLKLDPYAFLVMVWAILQAVWVSPLLVTQLFQTFKGITTQELTEGSRKRHGHDTTNEFFVTTPTDLMNEEELNALNQGSVNHNDRSLLRSRGCFSVCCSLIGLDQFVIVVRDILGLTRDSQTTRRTATLGKFATDYGWKTNLKDFWLLSDHTAPFWQRLLYSPPEYKANLNNIEVDYRTLYTLPERTIPQEQMV